MYYIVRNDVYVLMIWLVFGFVFFGWFKVFCDVGIELLVIVLYVDEDVVIVVLGLDVVLSDVVCVLVVVKVV